MSFAVSLDRGPLLALGIVSAPMPSHADRREAIRRTWLSAESLPSDVVAKFVLRHGTGPPRCPRGRIDIADAGASDMVLLADVCHSENRLRGTVLTVYGWLKYARRTFPHAAFIGRSDDDVWLNVPELSAYLNVIAARSTTHILAGRIFYSNVLALPDTHAEQDVGFGYNCGGALMGYHRHLKNYRHIANASLGAGPFAFATGFLTLLSTPLRASGRLGRKQRPT